MTAYVQLALGYIGLGKSDIAGKYIFGTYEYLIG